jgi:hypothetical protein
MKEITRAKGTRAVLFEVAKDFFKSDLVSVEEYHQQGARSIVLGTDKNYYECIQDHIATTNRRPITGIDWTQYWRQGGLAGNTWIEGASYITGIYPRWDGPVPSIATDPAKGLWPFQFYINIPTQKSPSAKFVKNADVALCTCESGYGYSPCMCDFATYLTAVSCACDATCYGDTPCYCDATCYGYGEGHSCQCDQTCYGYVACSCDSMCYGEGGCTCDGACYGYGGCMCDVTCYDYNAGVQFKLEGIPSMGWTYEAGYGYYYGYGTFAPIVAGTKVFSDPVNVGDSMLIGHQYQFSGVYFRWITPGVGGAYIWEYWNGAGWAILTSRDQNPSPVPGEENVDRLRQNGWIHWLEGLTGWQKANNVPYNIPDTGIDLYWVRCRVTTPPTTIPIVDQFWITYAGATCRGHFIAQGVDYDPAKRDKNNCYIYFEGSFAKPVFETGLQEIIDRLKTAGTCAIINPLD